MIVKGMEKKMSHGQGVCTGFQCTVVEDHCVKSAKGEGRRR